MAIVVGYFEGTKEDPIDRERAYAEGPFVIVEANGWRIEVDNIKEPCPGLPDITICNLRERLGYLKCGKFLKKEDAARLCDHLNMLVREGRIIQHERGYWYAPEFK